MELLGESALNMLRSPQLPQTEVVLTSIINEIVDIPTPVTLVLDDYHLIKAQLVHDALNFFIEHQPTQFHLVINTP